MIAKMTSKIWILLLVVLLGSLVHSQSDKSRSPKRTKGSPYAETGMIDIDERNNQAGGGSGLDKEFSSGAGWDPTRRGDEEEEEGEEIDEEDEEGSAAMPPPLQVVPPVKLTRCLKMRNDANSRQLPGAFRPQCTETGEFLPMQCHSSTGECWCVDKNGDEVVGTMRQAPDRPACSGRSGDGGMAQPGWEAVISTRPPGGVKQRTTTLSATDDIGFGESSKGPPKKELGPSEMDEEDDSRGDGGGGGVSKDKTSSKTFFDRIRDPLILAGVIGGAVLALLCIVLIVMFTIYRMRKKDEGSYALEEPRRNYDIRYTRTKDQEFFA